METNKYRTSGIIDEAAYREISKFSVSRGRVWFARIFSVFMGLFTILMLIVRDYPYMVLSLAFTVLFAVGPTLIAKLYLRGTLKRVREAYPDGRIQMETWFTEEGVALHNLSDGAQLVLPYSAFRKAAESEHYFYLCTKANQFTLVFKSYLTPSEQGEFLSFLQQKCPDIKVVRS